MLLRFASISLSVSYLFELGTTVFKNGNERVITFNFVDKLMYFLLLSSGDSPNQIREEE